MKKSEFDIAAEALSPPYNLYSGRNTAQFALVDFDESRTSQEFAEECDVNNIMAKYHKTGTVPVHVDRQPYYAAVDSYPSYHEMQNAIASAETAFANLPSHIRERFDNDPSKFVEFSIDDANVKELKELGLLSPEAVERLDAADAAEAARLAAEPPAPSAKGGQGEKKPAEPAPTQ